MMLLSYKICSCSVKSLYQFNYFFSVDPRFSLGLDLPKSLYKKESDDLSRTVPH